MHTQVLVTDVSSKSPRQLVGHSKGYVQVLLPYEPAHLGARLRVVVTATAKFHVLGEVVELLVAPPHNVELKAQIALAADADAAGDAEPEPEGEETDASADGETPPCTSCDCDGKVSSYCNF